MQITKSITARKIFEIYSELEKNCCMSGSGVMMVTLELGDDTTFDLIQKYIENKKTY
jgi:hypothetical protein